MTAIGTDGRWPADLAKPTESPLGQTLGNVAFKCRARRRKVRRLTSLVPLAGKLTNSPVCSGSCVKGEKNCFVRFSLIVIQTSVAVLFASVLFRFKIRACN